MMSTMDLTGDWRNWKASAPVELLRPEAPYECTARCPTHRPKAAT